MKLFKVNRSADRLMIFLATAALQRLAMLAAGIVMLSCSVWAQPQDAATQLPQLSEMTLPEFDELMKADPFDWVVLDNGSVLVTEPIYPRPDPLAMRAKERAELEATRGGTPAEAQARRDRLVELRTINLVLLEDRSADYRIPATQVAQIISFPELMLKRVDQLLDVGDIRKAYELLMEVEKMAPGWEQSVPRFDSLLLREADLRVTEGDADAALALLDELASRNPDNQQLPGVMGKVIDAQVQAAVAAEDFGKARYYLGRMSAWFPQHEVVTGWTQRLKGMMSELLQQAQPLAASGRHAEAAARARRADLIWRTTGNDREGYRQYLWRYQTLRVPVRDFARTDIVSPVPLEPEIRHRELTTVPLFEGIAADELTYFQSSYFDLWDPRDLGREVVFSVRQSRPYWQTQPILSANQIADTLGQLLDPDLDSFNPRLASFIREFSVPSPTELQVSFRRVPLSLEALFRFPVTGTPAPGQPTEFDVDRPVLSTRFLLAEQSEDRRLYQRTIAEPDGLLGPQYHVAEIEEIRYPDRDAEIRAISRGEVDVLPHLRPWEVDVFKALEDRFFVQQYAIPETHVIVFNPRSEIMSNAQLRRALSFGVDRENLLRVVLLRDPEMKYGRPISAPWRTGSYANNPLVKVPKYDHYLSYVLRMAAREQLRLPVKQEFIAKKKAETLARKENWDEEAFRRDHADEINAVASDIELPKLRMLVDPDETAVLAAEQMVERWQALGFLIELIPANRPGTPAGDSDWDLMYRRVRVQEPLLDLWPLLLTDDRFDVSRLSSYPDWMRQELINLDYATSFVDAQQKLFTIHRHIAAQSFVIPLWEIDDFMVFRRSLKDFQGRPLSVYHGVEKWRVTP